MATLDELQDELSEGIGAIEACREALETAAEEVPKLCLPKSGGMMTGPINRKAEFKLGELPETHSECTILKVLDSAGEECGRLYLDYDSDGQTIMRMFVSRVVDGTRSWHGLAAFIDENGNGYCAASHPRPDNYHKDVVTMKALKDYAPMKGQSATVDTYLDAVNGSDTDGLFAGRGFSPDKPFRTFGAALAFIMTNCAGSSTFVINLMSDITIDGQQYITNCKVGAVAIRGYGAERKVTITDRILVFSTDLILMENINLFGSGTAQSLLQIFSGSVVTFYPGVKVSGQVSSCVFMVSRGGVLTLQSSEAAIAGTITGRKYLVQYGGILESQGSLANMPGTIAGTCDEKSVAR